MRSLFVYLVGGLCVISVENATAEMESWYSYWSLGIANNQYDEPLDSIINSKEAIPGVSRTEMALDVLGFYWPIGNQSSTIAGFIINGSADRIYDSYDYYQINHYLYGGSVIHFFGREPGDGFFLRGDLGIAKYITTDSSGYNFSSKNGSGYLLGAGYGIPMSSGSRLLLSVTTTSRTIAGSEYNAIAFTIGGLW